MDGRKEGAAEEEVLLSSLRALRLSERLFVISED